MPDDYGDPTDVHALVDTTRPYTDLPEKRLCLALISSAIQALGGAGVAFGGRSPSSRKRYSVELAGQARRWFAEIDSATVSFRKACDLAFPGQDAESLARVILEKFDTGIQQEIL